MLNTLRIALPDEREILITRSFEAPRNLVFDCWTRPELLKRWMTGPDGWSFVVCEIDLRVGGSFRFVWQHEDGSEMGMGGVYREITPVERIVNTERYDEDWTGGETLVTAIFTEQDQKTTLTTIVKCSSKEARDRALASGMEQGLSAGYDRLDGYLASID